MKSLTLLIVGASFFFAPVLQAKVNPSKTAVIIVDMQEGFFSWNHTDTSDERKKLMDQQVILLSWAEAENVPVIFIECSGWGRTEPRLLQALPSKNYKIVRLYFVDDFSEEINSYLNERKINTIILGGIYGKSNVYETAQEAISRGFHVVSTGMIVGDFWSQQRPIFPDNSWFFDHVYFKGYDSLGKILY